MFHPMKHDLERHSFVRAIATSFSSMPGGFARFEGF